jgi:hypothetical protein
MEINFTLTDEKTITNTTVKISGWITGVVNGQDRATLETKSQELANKLFPDVSWAFSNFSYPDGFTFRVQVATRIDSAQNDQLDARAEEISDKGSLTIAIYDIDASIPLYARREAESDLRIQLIEKIKAEAAKLGGTAETITFSQASSHHVANATYAAASFSNSAPRGVVGDAGPGGPAGLGHSEKISLSATVKVKTAA